MTNSQRYETQGSTTVSFTVQDGASALAIVLKLYFLF